MASSKEYLEFILGQLSELEEITYRAMIVGDGSGGEIKSPHFLFLKAK